MLSTPYKQFDHKKFYSIIDSDPQDIPDFYASNIQNWIIRDSSQIEMRDGLTVKGASPSATNLGYGVLNKANGQKYLYRVLNGAADASKFQYSTDGSTWTNVTSGGSLKTGVRWHMVQANDFMYAVNGNDTPLKIDGTTASTVAGMPNGVAIEWWKNFLWILGVAATPDRLYFSNANTPETFGGSDYVNVNLGDGSAGVGLKGHPGQTGRLYIGKQRSVWYLTGTSSTDFAIAPLTYEHGVASHESMIQVKNDVWCIDQEGNIRGLYRTTTDEPFSALRSDHIQNTISGLNKSALNVSSAVFFDNYAMFFVPYGVDTYNSLVLVWDTQCNIDDKGVSHGGWTIFTNWNIAGAVIFNATQPQLYLHDARTGNGRTYQWSGTSDNGLSIIAKYETKIYDQGYPDRLKKWKFVYQHAPAMGTVPVRLYSSMDRFYYVLNKTFNLTGTGDKLLGVNWILGVDKLGSGGAVRQKIFMTEGGQTSKAYSVQYKLEAESSTVKVKLRNLSWFYKYFGLR
jgi:hypothetical protein